MLNFLQDNEGHLGLEYQQPNGNGNGNKTRRRKFTPTGHQSQGGVVKVAMIGEFSMSNFSIKKLNNFSFS